MKKDNRMLKNNAQKIYCRLSKKIKFGIQILLGGLGIWLIFAIIGDKNNYNKLLANRMVLWGVSLGVLGITFAIWKQCKIKSDERKADKRIKKITLLLFGITIYIWINIYFKVGWDVWTIDYAARTLIGDNEYISWLTEYFNMYQNNIVLTWIYAVTLIINKKIGVIDVQNGQVVFILLNTIIAWLTVYGTYYCIKRRRGIKIAILGWGICALLVGCSPWATVPYSDALTVGIPIAIYALYLACDKKRWWLYAIIFFCAVIGYSIKPQTVIIVVALVITEILHFEKKNLKVYMKRGVGALIGVGCAICICAQLTTMFKAKIPIETEKGFSYTHWMMMGMNNETGGRYNGDDVDFSASFVTKSERKRENLKIVQKRLKEFGGIKYLEFLTDKLALEYDDATFSWFTGVGNFVSEEYTLKNEVVAKKMREWYYYDGKYFSVYSTITQIIWFMVLSLCMIPVLKRRNGAHIIMLMLTILGVTAFELIFEVFTRHLYCNVPIYIILAMEGWNLLVVYGRRKMRICKSQN